MPELPEVERVARAVRNRVIGTEVAAAELLRKDFCESRRGGRVVATTSRDLLAGAKIVSVERRGKQFALSAADGRALCFHLGMSGQVLYTQAGDPPERDHVHARWRLKRKGQSAGWLYFRDPRRFGGLWSFDSLDDLLRTRWSELGPDALDIRADVLGRALARSQRSVKAALLDQGVLAGVGNIYADEALFRAEIHPSIPCRTLSQDSVARVAAAIRDVLAEAIASGGSTLRDFVDGNGAQGSYQDRHKVYGRAGLPCTRCGGLLVSCKLAQRTTVYCRHCQAKRPGRR